MPLFGFQTTPSSGESRLLGVPSRDLPDAVLERLRYAAQTPDLFPRLTGLEHLDEMAAVYPGVNLRDAATLAARLDLSLGQRAASLSQGDQQKLAVVLALAHDPDLLLLDEPVASLDPISRRDFMRALFALRRKPAPRTVLRSVPRPGRPAQLQTGELHWDGGRLVVDARQHPEAAAAAPLGMEDLLELLNL